jgi:cytochrome c2
MIRHLLLVFLALCLSLMLFSPALAGGWAVISLDSLPGEVVAGQPLTIGFKVLQHGKTPLSGLDPEIHLNNTASGEDFVVFAVDDGKAGHYSATFTLPESGNWRWSIKAFNMDQPMPELTVREPGALLSMAQVDPIQSSVPLSGPLAAAMPSSTMFVGLIGITVAGIGLIFTLRRRSKSAMAIIAVGLLVGMAGFVRAGIAAASPRSAETSKSITAPAPPSNFDGQGEALFIAKGCLSCHVNQRVDSRYFVFSTQVGPNLTSYQTSPEYLRLWLSNPKAVKPKTEMPDLGLSEAEIEALTSFLLQNGQE